MIGRATERISIEVCVFLRGRRVRMAQQLADDGQAEAKAGANARMGVAKIVDAQPFKRRSLDDSTPRPV